MDEKLFVKYDNKPPYLPIAVADSKAELARMLNIRTNVVSSAFSHKQSTYKVIKIDDGKVQEE